MVRRLPRSYPSAQGCLPFDTKARPKVTLHDLPTPYPLVSSMIESLALGLTVRSSLQFKGSQARMTLVNSLCRAPHVTEHLLDIYGPESSLLLLSDSAEFSIEQQGQDNSRAAQG